MIPSQQMHITCTLRIGTIPHVEHITHKYHQELVHTTRIEVWLLIMECNYMYFKLEFHQNLCK